MTIVEENKVAELLKSFPKKCIDAFLEEEVAYNVYSKTPIKIVSIKPEEYYPVEFEYKNRGYKGLVFSTRRGEVQIKA